MKKRAGHSFVLLNLMNSFYMCCIKDQANLIFASKREPKKGRETLTVKPFRSPVSGWNKEMLVFPPPHLGMVFDTLISESKANSVDICIHINNKIVQYKYKDFVFKLVDVCVRVCVYAAA